MMPGPTLVIECPNCRKTVLQETLSSGNTFSARTWSDGYQEAPMLPDYPEVTKCTGCKNIIWLSQGKVVDEIYFGEPLKVEIDYAKHLTIKELCKFLTLTTHTEEEEKYLRFRLWWRLNQRARKNPLADFSESNKKLFTANLVRLLNLAEPDNSDELLFRCEALRELGIFREAEELAKRNNRGYHFLLRQIVEKSRKNDIRVFEIDTDGPNIVAETYITGLKFHDYAAVERQKELDNGTKIVLRREAENTHDKNAVLVLTAAGKTIGYLPREFNREPAYLLDHGSIIDAVIVNVDVDAEEWERIKIALLMRYEAEDSPEVRARKNKINDKSTE